MTPCLECGLRQTVIFSACGSVITKYNMTDLVELTIATAGGSLSLLTARCNAFPPGRHPRRVARCPEHTMATERASIFPLRCQSAVIGAFESIAYCAPAQVLSGYGDIERLDQPGNVLPLPRCSGRQVRTSFCPIAAIWARTLVHNWPA